MARDLDRSRIRHVPLDKATALPTDGHWDVYADRWWCVDPEKGLLFYGKAPQCNSNEGIARKIQAKAYPDAELRFIERVYLRHDCGDYV